MAFTWPIPRKILQLKGNMSYRKLEQDIQKKTGKRVAYGTLRQLVCGINKGSPETIAILAEYAGKPLSWFFEDDEASPPSVPETVDETQIILSGIDDILHRAGINPDLKDRELLLNIVKAFIEKNKKRQN